MSKLMLEDAISKRRTHRAFDDRAVSLTLAHKLLWAAQGVTHDDKRTVPSAHALHPLRLYIVAGRIEGLEFGVHSASSDTTALTRQLKEDVRTSLEEAALDDQPWIANAAGIVTICADMRAPSRDFADQPPYGVRGRRYVYIEAGAAAQNVQLLASSEGLASVLVAGFRDEATANVLQLQAPLEPVLHVCFGWPEKE